ncbi:hypothetical protein ACHIPZ_03245 [Antrihabitans sp. NCIMB 15449]|uniref:Uncharacterized protein n=1 Tax=Antrihabitans spumae TaxID=3373370 RepID=A0ABW7JGY7_9NOCA
MEPAPRFDLKPYHLAWAGAALFGFFALLTLGNGVSTEKRNPRIILVLPAIVISTCIAGIMFLVQLVSTVIASDAFSVDALWTAFVTTLLIVTAVALPMDAFIAAVTVVGADRAIRGEQAKIGPVVSGALSRMFALIPLILVFYAILLLPYILIVPMSMIVMSGGAETLLILPSFALIAVDFVAGVLLSLAPDRHGDREDRTSRHLQADVQPDPPCTGASAWNSSALVRRCRPDLDRHDDRRNDGALDRNGRNARDRNLVRQVGYAEEVLVAGPR